MKHVSLIALVVLASFTLSAQKILKYTSNVYGMERENEPKLWFSDRPVTNREYLTYILWTMNTYGRDFPLTVTEILPLIYSVEEEGFDEQVAFAERPMDYYKAHSPEIIGHYFLNGRYLDYPVLGLSWYQAVKFNKWLADRYNEYTLIKAGYLDFNPEQSDAECFVTEAYLAHQYEGYEKKPNTVKWCDGLLIPSFRLPTYDEIEEMKEHISVSTALKAYPKSLPVFLKKWTELYIETNDTCMILNNDIYDPDNAIILPFPKSQPNLAEIDCTELTSGAGIEYSYDYRYEWSDRGLKIQPLDSYLDVEFQFPEKDSLGQMPYIIIGEYDSGAPMTLEHFKTIDPKTNPSLETVIFRYVLSFGK
jgi:hypothetical protein